MTLMLYERLCAEGRRPSPYCWRARLALAHKGLDPAYEAIKFTEAERVGLQRPGQGAGAGGRPQGCLRQLVHRLLPG